MKNAPRLYLVDRLINEGKDCQAEIDGMWIAARPLWFCSIKERLQLTWGVFIGKYDALKWYKQ